MHSATATQFRKACGQFLTGVTVVTTRSANGQPTGLTANSFTSVSLDPPMVLVCIDKNIRSHSAFMQSATFAVHVLGSHQEEISRRFASRDVDKFTGLECNETPDGTPLLPDYLVMFHCRIARTYEGGDHTILLGEVESMDNRGEATLPLGFLRGKYLQLPG